MSAKLTLDEVLTRHNVGMTAAEYVAQLDARLSRATHPAAASPADSTSTLEPRPAS